MFGAAAVTQQPFSCLDGGIGVSSQSEPLTGFQRVLVCRYECCLFTFSA